MKPLAGGRPRGDPDPRLATESPDHLPGSVRVAESEAFGVRHRRGTADRERPGPEPRGDGSPGRAGARRCGPAAAEGLPVPVSTPALRRPATARVDPG